jgi:alanine racemase
MENYESSQNNELRKVFCNIEKDKALNKTVELKDKTLKHNLKIELGIKRECFRIKALK